MVLTILGAINISIHAPVKGATSPCLSLSNPLQYFNPRSREGSDLGDMPGIVPMEYFNPRSREGSDSSM